MIILEDNDTPRSGMGKHVICGLIILASSNNPVIGIQIFFDHDSLKWINVNLVMTESEGYRVDFNFCRVCTIGHQK